MPMRRRGAVPCGDIKIALPNPTSPVTPMGGMHDSGRALPPGR
jgi:hypothetical protein